MTAFSTWASWCVRTTRTISPGVQQADRGHITGRFRLIPRARRGGPRAAGDPSRKSRFRPVHRFPAMGKSVMDGRSHFHRRTRTVHRKKLCACRAGPTPWPRPCGPLPGRRGPCQEFIARDADINGMVCELDEFCLRILALEQPVPWTAADRGRMRMVIRPGEEARGPAHRRSGPSSWPSCLPRLCPAHWTNWPSGPRRYWWKFPGLLPARRVDLALEVYVWTRGSAIERPGDHERPVPGSNRSPVRP
jgi:hypothetical protein